MNKLKLVEYIKELLNLLVKEENDNGKIDLDKLQKKYPDFGISYDDDDEQQIEKERDKKYFEEKMKRKIRKDF